jgi:hypothetical protein
LAHSALFTWETTSKRSLEALAKEMQTRG